MGCGRRGERESYIWLQRHYFQFEIAHTTLELNIYFFSQKGVAGKGLSRLQRCSVVCVCHVFAMKGMQARGRRKITAGEREGASFT